MVTRCTARMEGEKKRERERGLFMPFDRIIPNDYFYVCFPVREEVFERALKWLPVLPPRVASRAEGNICRGGFFCPHSLPSLLITCLESRGGSV